MFSLRKKNFIGIVFSGNFSLLSFIFLNLARSLSILFFGVQFFADSIVKNETSGWAHNMVYNSLVPDRGGPTTKIGLSISGSFEIIID